jgi:hypothetical protein
MSGYLFAHGSNQWNFPIGRLAGMNYANRSSFQGPFLNLLAQVDPLGENQWTLFKTKMEMRKFSNAFYDPTVTLTSLFGDSAPESKPNQGSPGSSGSVEPNLGIAVGIPVAVVIVIAVAVVLTFILYKPLRAKVAPFSSRRLNQATPLDEDEPKPSTTPKQEWKASRGPLVGKGV